MDGRWDVLRVVSRLGSSRVSGDVWVLVVGIRIISIIGVFIFILGALLVLLFVLPLVLFNPLFGALAFGFLDAVGIGMEEVIGYLVEVIVD
jgi:hypothetical protein